MLATTACLVLPSTVQVAPTIHMEHEVWFEEANGTIEIDIKPLFDKNATDVDITRIVEVSDDDSIVSLFVEWLMLVK